MMSLNSKLILPLVKSEMTLLSPNTVMVPTPAFHVVIMHIVSFLTEVKLACV